MTDRIIELITSRETIELHVERGDRLTLHKARPAVLVPSGVFTFLGRTTEWVVEEADAGEVYLVEVTDEQKQPARLEHHQTAPLAGAGPHSDEGCPGSELARSSHAT